MITEMILVGLVSEICGVIVLVNGSHIGFSDVLDHLGRTVPDDWNERVKKFRLKHKISTLAGLGFLALGFFFQYYGILW